MKARNTSLWLILVFCVLAYSQPANDLCSNAIEILPSNLLTSYSFSGTTASSNKEHSCPQVTGTTSPAAGDVWFFFTPSRNLLVDVSLCGSSFNTYLYVASGSCSSLSCLVASDNSLSCSTNSRSNVRAFSMLQGVTYYIIVSGSGSTTGAYVLTVSENTGSASCASATTISSIPFISSIVTLSATSVQATPCRTGASGWFTFIPESTMTVKISTCSSAVDTFVSVATGSCPFGLSCIASNDDSPVGGCSSTGSSARAFLGNFQLTEGVRYFFIVTTGGAGTTIGTIQLAITPVPGNDLCSAAIPITALPASLSGDTSGTGRENTCPNMTPTSQTAGDVWFTFTPAANVIVDVSLCSSLYDTYVYIASGSCSSLSCLISNDDSRLCSTTSRSYVQAFPMVGGVTYYIIVSGANGGMGTFSLSVTENTGATSCSLATPITDLPFSATPTLDAASRQSSPCRTGPSVWYSFTPTAPVSVSISTCSSSLSDTFLSVVTGSCPFGLSCIATNDNSPVGGCSATATNTRAFLGPYYPLAAGQQYFFVLTAGGSGTTTGTSSISIYIPPENDICSTAIPISLTGSTYTHSGDTTFANKESTCPPLTTAPDVWYSFTPTADMFVDVSLCGSAFDTFVYIASGSCSSLSCLASNNDNPSSGCSDATRSVIQGMPMGQGTTYFIIVTGSGASKGAYTLTVTVNTGAVAGCLAPTTAISSLPYTSPSTPISSSISATPCVFAAASAWFTFTPSSTIGVSINTCASDFDTILSVSSGTCPFGLSCISSNDDNPFCSSATRSFLSMLFAGNVQYFINVAGRTGSGNVVLSVARNNDFCQDPTVISSLPFSFSGSTVGFAKNHNCLTPGGSDPGIAPDAWFSITPTSSVVVDINLCVRDYDTYLYIASGSDCSSLTCLAANDDNFAICGPTSSGSVVLGMPLVQGVPYFFIVSGFGGLSGTYTLSVSVSTTSVTCTTSTAINSLPFTSGPVVLQSGVRSTPCRLDVSAWYSYTPSFSHLATISSCNPTSSTVVGLSSGSCPAIACLVVNFSNPACPSGRGGVVSNYLLTASTQYFITISQLSGSSGTVPGFTMTGSSMNDGCSQATVIPSLPFSTSHSVTFATQDFSCTSGTSTLPSSGADVWYSFTPSTNLARVAISTCSSLSQFGIYVASGSCSSSQCVRSDSSSCPSGGSGYLEIPMQSGTTYFIAVSSFSASPDFQLDIITFVGLNSITITSPTAGATLGLNNFNLLVTGETDASASVQLVIGSSTLPTTATSTGSWQVDITNTFPLLPDGLVTLSVTSTNTVDNVATASVTFTKDTVISFAITTPSDPYLNAQTNFNQFVVGGTGETGAAYTISIPNASPPQQSGVVSGGVWEQTFNIASFADGPFTISGSSTDAAGNVATASVTFIKDTSVPPPNNACNAATTITSLPYSVSASTVDATADFSCSGNPSVVSSISDVWYSFTPSSNLPAIVISTCFSPSAHTLYLASGSCASRQCIQSDSSSCPYADGIISGWIQSSMQASTTYFIAVASASPGPFQLDVFIPPVNDQCSGATQINSLPFTSPVASTTNARPDFTCSQNSLRNRDIFYTFTPSSSYTDVSISLCGSNFDTFVFLASGTCAGLTCIAWNDDSVSCEAQSILEGQSFNAGTTYFIIVSGASAPASGSVSLSITGTRSVGCAVATEIPSIPYSFSASTSSDADPAIACIGNPVGGVTGAFWFTFTPTSTINNVYISACSSFGSVLVFASGSCSSLECSAPSGSNSDFCLAQNSAGSQIASVSLVGGVQYFFVVTGSSASDFGAFTLTLSIDSSAEVSILTPAADAVIGGSQLRSLLISGAAGSFDAQGTVTLTISDSVLSTPDLSATAIVSFNAEWSVPVNILSLADGLIVVNARLVDPSGNTAVATRTFSKDATTFVFVSAPAANSFVNAATSSSFLVQGTGEVGGTVIVTVMDGDSSTVNVVSAPVTVLADGSWSVVVSIVGLRDGVIRLTASITDSVGNTQVSPTVTLNKDTTVSLVITSPTPFQFTISQANAPSVSISGFGDPGNQVVVVVSDGLGGDISRTTTVTPVGTWRVVVDVSSLSDGTLSFLATATDASNNLQSQSVNLMKATQVSAPSISTPVNGATVGSSLSISGTALPLARVNVTISSSGVINSGKLQGATTISRQPLATSTGTWTTSVSISNMSGTLTIWATAKDSLNNVSPASPSVVVTKANS